MVKNRDLACRGAEGQRKRRIRPFELTNTSSGKVEQHRTAQSSSSYHQNVRLLELELACNETISAALSTSRRWNTHLQDLQQAGSSDDHIAGTLSSSVGASDVVWAREGTAEVARQAETRAPIRAAVVECESPAGQLGPRLLFSMMPST